MRAVHRVLPVQLLMMFGAWAASVAQTPDNELVLDRQETVYSAILQEERVIKIRVPEGYDDSDRRYPVLYVLDADARPFYEHAVGAVGFAAMAETIPQMIVVGIRNTNRNRDMIPAAVAHRHGSGGSREFLHFLSEELMPHLDREYRTNGTDILYGASNAGLFTVFAMLESPETFDAGIAASPMIGHTSDFMYRVSEDLRDGDRYDGRALFMVYGEHDSPRCVDFLPAFKEHIDTLRPPTFRTELVLLPDEGHVPQMSLYLGLRYAFGEER